jgi:hypothetical protein
VVPVFNSLRTMPRRRSSGGAVPPWQHTEMSVQLSRQGSFIPGKSGMDGSQRQSGSYREQKILTLPKNKIPDVQPVAQLLYRPLRKLCIAIIYNVSKDVLHL